MLGQFLSLKKLSALKGKFSFKGINTTNGSPLFDWRLKWALILVIVTINYVITYTSFDYDLEHLYFIISDIINAYLILSFYLICIRILDKKVPWGVNNKKRLAYQLTVVSLAVLIFYILINELFDLIDGTSRTDASFYSLDFFVAVLFNFIVQFLDISLFFIFRKVNAVSAEETVIKLTYGKSSKLFKESDILAVFVDPLTNITYILDKANAKFVVEKPLKELEEKLSDKFFRANRQFIVSRQVIAGFKSADYGKIEVGLIHENTPLPEKIIISRTKAAQFRKWLG